MAAPKENQFWKIRTKHGRDAIFENAQLLEETFKEYINWVDGHPWYKMEQLKKPYQESITGRNGIPEKRWVTIAKVPTARPYTIQGFCIYLGVNTVWFNQFEKSIKEKIAQINDDTDPELVKKLNDFSQILSHVRDVIYQQKFEGAAVGSFNASIIQRDLGLKDNQDVKLSNPEGEVFRTSNQHEVIFKRFSDKPADDNQPDI